MTLIERINGFINAVASDIKSLYANKVNKTDVIAVAQGGTGGTDAATARSNLGLGTAATANLTDSNLDSERGKVLKVGDFGIGGASVNIDTDLCNTNGFTHSYDVGTNMKYNAVITAVHNKLPDQYAWQIGAPMGETNMRNLGVRIRSDGVWFPKATIYNSDNTPILHIPVKSISAGSASYAKGWRKLTTTLPSTAGEVTLAHGVTTVETVQAKVTNSDGIIIHNNDIDPANQFYVRVNGANLVLGVTANSTKVFGRTVTIYVGEEL